jgi:catechol 2,3-dioxygenase-like lactoylglutathione lyase family enzyme
MPMPVRLENVTLDCRDERVLAAFWSAVLGWAIVVDQPGDWLVLRDPAGTEPTLAFQVVPEPKIGKNRMHLDLVPAAGALEPEIQRLEGLGARRLHYVENDPDESHWIMADPEGNEFCVSRPPWEPRPDQPERPSPS